MEKLACLHIQWGSKLQMVKTGCIALVLIFMHSLTAMTIDIAGGSVIDWKTYSSVGESEVLDFVLNDPSLDLRLISDEAVVITQRIRCNGTLRITSSSGPLIHKGSLSAPSLILEAPHILLESGSLMDASRAEGEGLIHVGGGWQGKDPGIKNATRIDVQEGAQLRADARRKGKGGVIVLWSEESTCFRGAISSRGILGCGGNVEISSHGFLDFDGSVDVSAKESEPGQLLLDPVSITIQAASPDINGNRSDLDMTTATQLNGATTTPAGFPNASSIITATALESLLTAHVNIVLAAQQFIAVNAPITSAATGITLQFAAPLVALNSPISFPHGVVAGTGVSVVNVGPLGNPQNGIDIVMMGGVVNLASATYPAPLSISGKNLTLSGNGQGNTLIQVQGAIPSHSSRNPAIYIENTDSVTVQHLTVDGQYKGFPTNGSIVGVHYVNAGGKVWDTHITRIANEPPPYTGGGQQGNGIRAVQNAGGPYTLNIDSNFIDLFQKAGIVANGPFNVNITNNTVAGYGSPVHLASIGIQVNGGAGTLSGNVVTGLQYAVNYTLSDGLLIFGGGSLLISGNTLSNNDEGVVVASASGEVTLTNNQITGNGDGGIVVADTSALILIDSNTLMANGGSGGTAGGGTPVNSSIYLSSSTTQPMTVSENVITPNPNCPALFIQGMGTGEAPDVTLFNNILQAP
jgi:parallel beta-helix repeat protein